MMFINPVWSAFLIVFAQITGAELSSATKDHTNLDRPIVQHRHVVAGHGQMRGAHSWCAPKQTQIPKKANASQASSMKSRADEILAGIQSFYGQTADLKSDFIQTYTYKVYNRTQVSKGRVFFKKPGMMRWDYAEPTPKVFVADGETLWVYEPNENQVFKRQLNRAQLPVALSFMSGKGKLKEAFRPRVRSEQKERLELELIPLKSRAEFRMLVLEVDPTSYAVRASTVVDPLGNTNHILFKNLATNANLPLSGFQFSPPEGVRIIQGPKTAIAP